MPKIKTGLLVQCAMRNARGTLKETKERAREVRASPQGQLLWYHLNTNETTYNGTTKEEDDTPTGKGTQVQVRLQPKQLARLDAWIRNQADLPTRLVGRAQIARTSVEAVEAPLSNKVCPTCGSPLMKIDTTEVLIGCVHCNYWRRPGDKRPIMEMLEDDLEALRANLTRKRH